MSVVTTTTLRPALTGGEPACTKEFVKANLHNPWGLQCEYPEFTWQGKVVICILILALIVGVAWSIHRLRGREVNR